jgi:predicted metal-dependent peptidase
MLMQKHPPTKVMIQGTGAGNGNCGTCSTHSPKDGDGDKDGVSEDEKGQMVKSAALKAAEHAAKHPGSVPGSLVRLAEELSAPPRVRWEEKLRRAINGGQARAMGAVDYTFLRPSRRTRKDGVILPRLAAPKPSVSVVVDTSGSMGDEILGKLLNEVRSILLNAERVFWIPTDTQAHGTFRIRSVAAARDKVLGGGGTDLTTGLVAASEKHTPVTVVLTDGWNSWTRDKPAGLKDVIILRTDKRAEEGYPMPPWAHGIDVDL